MLEPHGRQVLESGSRFALEPKHGSISLDGPAEKRGFANKSHLFHRFKEHYNITPALTMLLRNYPKMCNEALNLLERTLKPDGAVKNILIPGRIIERKSVAPPPKNRKN